MENDYKPCWEVDDNGHIIEHYFSTNLSIQAMKSDGKRIIDFTWEEGLHAPKFDFETNKWVSSLDSSTIEAIHAESKKMLEIDELKKLLSSTDFYYIRELETKKPIPAEIKTKRINARNRLNELGL